MPFPMTRLCVCAPDVVVIGAEKGMMSSSVACKLNDRIAVSGDLAWWSVYRRNGAYDARGLVDGRVQSEYFLRDCVEVGQQPGGELVERWVCP